MIYQKKFAGTTMFNKQRKVPRPFYDPINLEKVYPDAKDFKLYKCNLKEEPISNDVN